MEVRPTPLDDDALASWYDAIKRGWEDGRPWESAPPLKHYSTLFRTELASERNEPFAAYDGERVVGAGYVSVPLESNTDKVEFILAVPPEHRRRGVGAALLEEAVARATAAGADYAITMTSYPFEERETHGFRRFAEANGFALDLDEVHRMLPLPVDEALLRKLADEAAARHEGYRIETWVNEIPAKYRESWLVSYNLLAIEAPMGAVPWTADSYSEQTYHEEFAMLRESGRIRYSSVAISPDDEVVAYTDLLLRADGSGRVSQWGTLVRPDHRGHRLGTAVKVANLQALQHDHPESTEVHTTNAEVNDAMIGINEVLGFRAVAVHPGFFRRLS